MITNRHWIFISTLLTLQLLRSVSTSSNPHKSVDKNLMDIQFDESLLDDEDPQSYIILRQTKRSEPGYNVRLMKKSDEYGSGNYKARLMKKSLTEYNKRLMKRFQFY